MLPHSLGSAFECSLSVLRQLLRSRYYSSTSLAGQLSSKIRMQHELNVWRTNSQGKALEALTINKEKLEHGLWNTTKHHYWSGLFYLLRYLQKYSTGTPLLAIANFSALLLYDAIGLRTMTCCHVSATCTGITFALLSLHATYLFNFPFTPSFF